MEASRLALGSTIQGSYFGIERTGTARLGYTDDAVDLVNSPSVTIGGLRLLVSQRRLGHRLLRAMHRRL